MFVCLCTDLAIFKVLWDTREIFSPMPLCILKVHFLSLKHCIPGRTMLLTSNLINKTPQASLSSNLDPSHKPSSRILFHTYLPAVSFWPSCCWSLYPPLRKLADHLAHLPGYALSPTLQAFFPPIAILVSPPSSVMNSWASGHILFPYVIYLDART